MKTLCYHSTIKEKIDLIVASGKLSPGKDSIHYPDGRMDELYLMGCFDNYSTQHVYVWRDLRDALLLPTPRLASNPIKRKIHFFSRDHIF